MREELNQGLIDFLKASPTPFHATASLARLLEIAGYQRLDEREAWQAQAGGRYYVTRNDSSLIAIQLGRRAPLEGGLRLVGAHTDSPCLRVKPQPELTRQGFWQLGVEVYGGALLAPWFDRDLSLAGRVTFKLDGKLHSRLIDFKAPIAVIPNLAIHLNREANQGWEINKQTELPPILAQLAAGEQRDFRTLLARQLEHEHGLQVDAVLDFELSFYDTQSAAVIGLEQEFITPHCPQQNGLVERVIRTIKEQCVHRHRFESQQHAMRVIGDWIGFYNSRRPHQALGMKTPDETFKLAA